MYLEFSMKYCPCRHSRRKRESRDGGHSGCPWTLAFEIQKNDVIPSAGRPGTTASCLDQFPDCRFRGGAWKMGSGLAAFGDSPERRWALICQAKLVAGGGGRHRTNCIIGPPHPSLSLRPAGERVRACYAARSSTLCRNYSSAARRQSGSGVDV